jgi:hypothetical protein
MLSGGESMSIAGKLEAMPLEDLLGWVSASDKTGTLVLEGPEFTKRLVIEDGNLVAFASTNPKEYLGTYLVGWGYVSAEELDDAVAMQSTQGMLIGELLVNNGRIAPECLDEILTVVAKEGIVDAFLWPDGSFRFNEGVRLPQRFRPINLQLIPLLIDGTRRRDDLPIVTGQVPSVYHRPRLLAAKNSSTRSLSPDKLAVIIGADGSKSVEQLAFACRRPTFAVHEIFASAALNGLVEILPPSSEASDMHSVESFGSVRDLVLNIEQSIESRKFEEALSTIDLLGRRFRTASDINVLITTLNRKLESAIRSYGPNQEHILETGVLDDVLLYSEEDSPDRLITSLVDGRKTFGEILDHLPGDITRNRLAVLGLIKRGVFVVRSAAG